MCVRCDGVTAPVNDSGVCVVESESLSETRLDNGVVDDQLCCES